MATQFLNSNEFADAIIKGDCDLITELVKKHGVFIINTLIISSASKERIKMLPVHIAARYGQINVFDTLYQLSSGIFNKTITAPTKYDHIVVNGRNYYYTNFVTMHIAAIYGQSEVIELLVKKYNQNVDVVIYGSDRTPMHFAASLDHANVIRSLVKLGSKAINKPDIFKSTPLDSATHASYSTVKCLMDSGSILGLGKSLDSAVSVNNVEFIEALIQFVYEPKLNPQPNTHNQLKINDQLKIYKDTINKSLPSLLFIAVRRCSSKMICALTRLYSKRSIDNLEITETSSTIIHEVICRSTMAYKNSIQSLQTLIRLGISCISKKCVITGGNATLISANARGRFLSPLETALELPVVDYRHTLCRVLVALDDVSCITNYTVDKKYDFWHKSRSMDESKRHSYVMTEDDILAIRHETFFQFSLVYLLFESGLH